MVAKFLQQMAVLYRNLSPARRLGLMAVIGFSLAGIVLVALWSGRPDYQLLYSGLTAEDAGQVIARLREQKIPFQLAANGNSVLVPRQNIHETRIQLASQGLPQGGGVGFEIFDNAKLGMSEFSQNVNYQRALQGELARTIARIDEVESSRVHIVMPSRSLFVEEAEPASASVVVQLHPGRRLRADQVKGIVNLLSSSVPGLDPQSVTVVDGNGRMLTGLRVASAAGELSTNQHEFRERLEQKLEHRIKSMLEAALGPSKAIVRLACRMNFKRSEKTEERFFPDNKVVRSQQVLRESSRNSEKASMGGPAMTSSGSVSAGGSQSDAKQLAYLKEDQAVNYEIGRMTSRVVEPVGQVERISVAVLVDGTYKEVENAEGETELKYVPRSSEELAKLENIVKRAVNFDADRGDEVEVVNMPFETAQMAGTEAAAVQSGWLDRLAEYQGLLKYVLALTVVLLVFFFVLRPLVRWTTSSPGVDVELLQQLPKTVSEVEKDYSHQRKSLPFWERANQMISTDNQKSLEVMRNWMQGS